MKWVAYNVLFAVAYMLLVPHWVVRMVRRGGYGEKFMERLGRYGAQLQVRLRGRRRVWVHAVSVGEVHVAGNLMREWRERDPAVAFVLSVNTSTGRDVAQRYLGDGDELVYFPCDFPWVVNAVLGK